MKAIEASNLTKTYKGDVRALDGLSVEVEAGTIFGLLGPNGAGKSTTVKILTTLSRADDGEARVAGLDVVRDAVQVRQSIGVVGQKSGLDPESTGRENLEMQAEFYGIRGDAKRDRVEQLLDDLGLADAGKRLAKTYSGGMQRRLDVALGLIHRPKVLFLDEPTAGLDVPSRRTLWEYLTTIRRESGTTIFLTTHYLEEAEEADHICIIDKGKIVKFGTPDEIKRELVQEYVLVDADDRRRLREELARLELPVEGTGPFKIMLGGRGVHAILKAIDTPCTLVRTHAPTLEDAYLEIVSPVSE